MLRQDRIEEAAKAIIANHPANWNNGNYDEDGGYYACFYCGVEQHFTRDYDIKTSEMSTWLQANPSPNLYQQTIKRKNASDMQAWDRENSRRHNSYRQLYGAWRKRYEEAHHEIWGDPAQHPGTVIEHKEDCIWRLLKEALDA